MVSYKMNRKEANDFVVSLKREIVFKNNCSWRNGARFVLMKLEEVFVKDED